MTAASQAGRSVVFVVVPDFYAEVERRANPNLRGSSILVGGDPTKRGKVQSASREARESGVRVGMAMREAMGLCPGAISCATNMKLYREVSGTFVSCLRESFHRLEIGGLGEIYSEIPRRISDPSDLGERVLIDAQEKMGLPMKLGIAPSKLVSRLAAEEASQGSMLCLESGGVARFLAPLALSRLPRVGEKTEIRLRELGASTVGQLLALDPNVVEEVLGNHGLSILEMARGQDRSTIRTALFPKSITREETLTVATSEKTEWMACLSRLASAIEASLLKQGLRAGRVAVRVRMGDETRQTRSQTLQAAIERGSDLYGVAKDLLARCDLSDASLIRSLGIVVAGLELASGAQDAQLDLFNPSS